MSDAKVQPDRPAKEGICPPVARPEWVKLSVTDVIKSLECIRDGRLPEALHGAFLRTSALRLLRCVYGTDEASVVAVQEHLAVMQEMRRKAGADA
jgi:hypothetical protein